MKNIDKKVIKKERNFYYWMGKISDILIYPIILLALISSFAMFTAKMENKVYMIAGHSIVRVLSGSMLKDGFEIGDSVIIRKADTDKLRPGDIISFYYFQDVSYDSRLDKQLITDFDNLPYKDIDEIDYEQRKSREDAEKAKAKVYFHTIVEVYMAEDGVRFFKTKGSSNASADLFYTREDFVVGKYINTPNAVRDVFKFFSSTIGMIILVIVPLTILICMQMLSLLEQVSVLMLEKKVLQKQVEYDTEECLSSNVATDMRNFDKLYLYDIISDKKKDRLSEYMWKHLEKSRSKKFRNVYKYSLKSTSLYPVNRYSYYYYWMAVSSSYSKNKIVQKLAIADKIKYYEENNLDISKIFNTKKRIK